MRKRIVMLAMAAVLCAALMSGCGTSGKGPGVSEELSEGASGVVAEVVPDSENASEPASEATEDGSDVGSSEQASGEETGAEKSDDDVVDLTIPASFAGQEINQKRVDLIVQKNGWISGKYNEADDTITYYMTRKQYNELIEKTKAEIRKNLQQFVDSKTFPGVTKVETNDDFTEFKVYCESKENAAGYGAFLYICQAQAATYGMIVGSDVHYHVDFSDESTGEVFDSYDSADAGKK